MRKPAEIKEYVEFLWDQELDACIDSLVKLDQAEDDIVKDMFGIIAKVVVDMQDDGKTHRQIEQVLKNFEKEYKAKHKLRHMPSAYRSAKSVLITALKEEVEIKDHVGVPLSKSQIEKATKAVRQVKAEHDKYVDHELEKMAREGARLVNYCAPCRNPRIGNPNRCKNLLDLIERDLRLIRQRLNLDDE